MTTAKVKIPKKLIPVFTKEGVRYRGAYGGRGSAKSRTFALMSAIHGYRMAEQGQSGIILCAREYMNSLDESSMEEIKQAIREIDWLNDYYEIGEKYIRTKNRLVEYAFTGLRHNLASIKSKARILLCWIDEADSVSENAYIKLEPTIREEGSEIWVTWNPEIDGSPTDKRFRKDPPKDAIITEINYCDNEFFPEVLEKQRKEDQKRLDPATYAHVWEGVYLENSEAQILHGKVRVEEFEPKSFWGGPYFGLDWGFANDPTAGTKSYVYDNVLYIEYEAGKVGLELDETADYLIANLPEIEQHTVRADSARPESISYVKRKGLPRVEAVDKWPGSVEDGIAHLRGYYEIVIHPRCVETIKETRLYSYKKDRLSGDVLPKIVDAHNHYIDSIRYGLSPLIRKKPSAGILRGSRHGKK